MEAPSIVELAAGFRFCPTDGEIVIHYLLKKVLDKRFVALAIGEADLNKTEPWDLPKMAKTGEKEWFFFWQRYRKYPTGTRTNRATESGYWKATGKDKKIYKGRNSLVGMKKTLVFYKGRAPKGERTNWVMHEYRLEGDFSNYNFSRAAKEEWVVCRVIHKNTIIKTGPDVELSRKESFSDPLLNSPKLQPLRDYENPTPCFATDYDDEFKPNISSSTVMFNNHKLQISHHDQINFPLALPFQSTITPHNVGPTPVYSILSHSQDTGLSTQVVTDQTASVHSDGDVESKKPFDEQLDEGLYFDSLWSY